MAMGRRRARTPIHRAATPEEAGQEQRHERSRCQPKQHRRQSAATAGSRCGQFARLGVRWRCKGASKLDPPRCRSMQPAPLPDGHSRQSAKRKHASILRMSLGLATRGGGRGPGRPRGARALKSIRRPGCSEDLPSPHMHTRSSCRKTLPLTHTTHNTQHSQHSTHKTQDTRRQQTMYKKNTYTLTAAFTDNRQLTKQPTLTITLCHKKERAHNKRQKKHENNSICTTSFVQRPRPAAVDIRTAVVSSK
eukprot:scaffold15394_cov111-Isochrysis_galbana.AAC.7